MKENHYDKNTFYLPISLTYLHAEKQVKIKRTPTDLFLMPHYFLF